MTIKSGTTSNNIVYWGIVNNEGELTSVVLRGWERGRFHPSTTHVMRSGGKALSSLIRLHLIVINVLLEYCLLQLLFPPFI